jgi:hypothetical protein
MSYVTSVILTYPLWETSNDSDEKEDVGGTRLEEINNGDWTYSDIKFVYDFEAEQKICGGSKALERWVLIGSFNYLDVGKLMDHLNKVNWIEPYHVQLLVCGENDDVMTLFCMDKDKMWHLIYPTKTLQLWSEEILNECESFIKHSKRVDTHNQV